MASTAGVEPATSASAGLRSVQLSYEDVKMKGRRPASGKEKSRPPTKLTQRIGPGEELVIAWHWEHETQPPSTPPHTNYRATG